MTLPPTSLRARLAAVALVGVLVPLLALLAVAAAVDEEQVARPGPDGVVTERTRGLSPWLPISTAAIAVPAAAAAWWWAGRAVRPLREITEVADEIGATSLDRRIGMLEAAPEVRALAERFDAMLDRLAADAEVHRRLLEDVSHQLRTPLAVLAANAEVVLAEPRPTVDDLRSAMETTQETVARMRAVVDGSLAAARAEHVAATTAGCDLVSVVNDVVATYREPARAAGVGLDVRSPQVVPLGLDPGPVGRAVASLVENAVGHAPAGTEVLIEVVDTLGEASVAVTDAGPGIAPADRPHVFERYWSTGPRGGGTGIGLAVVKQVADAHGSVDVESPVSDHFGTRVTLRLVR